MTATGTALRFMFVVQIYSCKFINCCNGYYCGNIDYTDQNVIHMFLINIDGIGRKIRLDNREKNRK